MRNQEMERSLCNAIKNHFSIRIQYKDEDYWRTFEPYTVYESTKEKILVAGTQTLNDAKPNDDPSPKNFEVSLISGFKVTEEKFEVDPLFDPSDKKYSNGFVCVIS